jgi:hypothetical protein
MTTYDDQDQSVHDSQPIECYLFEGPNFTMGYNDSDEDVTVNGQLYTKNNVGRDSIKVGTSIGQTRVTGVFVPFDSEVAIEFGYLLSPDFLNVTIIRLERGTVYDTDHKVVWLGRAMGFSTSGLMVKVDTQSAGQSGMTLQLLTAYWQRTCNFDLYDADTCKADKSANTVTSTVTVVGPSAITVVDDGFADHVLPVGEVTNDRTGEKRLIIDNLANVITLSFGFTDVIVGDTVTIVKGCKHTSEDCILSFDNILNYGGYRFIPRKSPL